MTTNDLKQGITIDTYCGITRVWYRPVTPAPVRFTAGLIGLVRANAEPLHVGHHSFADETLCYPPGYALEPKPIDGCLIDTETLDADTRAVLDEWVKFCDEAIETTAFDGDCDEEDVGYEEVTEAMQRTWFIHADDANRIAAVNAAA